MTYPEKLKRWMTLANRNAERLSVWVCFLTALLTTFALYPGWLFFDSAQQWGWARQFANGGWPSSLKSYQITNHWPIFNTIIKVPFYQLTHETGFYILVQAFLFNLSLYFVGRALIGRQTLWLLVFTIVMVVSPISLNMAVFHSSDTIVAFCALVMLAMLVDDQVRPWQRALWIGVAAVVMSLVRYNALTAAVPLVILFYWAIRDKWSRAQSKWAIIGILLATVLGVIAARSYEHTAYRRPSVVEGPMLRMLEASRLTSDPAIHAVVDPRIKINPRLRQPLGPDCYIYGYWCAQIGGPWEGLSTHVVMRTYLHFMVHHPWTFLRVNSHFAWYAMGLGAPLQARQLGRTDIFEPFPAARMVFNHRRFAMLSAFRGTLDLFDGLASRAYIIFLAGLVAAALLRRRWIFIGYLVLSIGYSVPIILLASDTIFRYMFPVIMPGMAIFVAGCCVLLQKGSREVHARALTDGTWQALTVAHNRLTQPFRLFRSRRRGP
ncbi:MAG TPA: hypothetical protein VHA71_05120 [Rhodanobacteraceae bacterium]|nr:hypothetical protein [Rhodanobacteraceae bacterium]